MVELIQHLLKVFDLIGKDFGILDSKLLVFFIKLSMDFKVLRANRYTIESYGIINPIANVSFWSDS